MAKAKSGTTSNTKKYILIGIVVVLAAFVVLSWTHVLNLFPVG